VKTSGGVLAALACAAIAAAACGGGGSDARPTPASEFERLIQASQEVSFQVRYEARDTTGDDTSAGTLLWYQDPPRARFELELEGDKTIIVLTPGGGFTCFNGVCQEDSGGTNVLTDAFGDLLTNSQPTGESTRQIAGRTAICFTVTATGRINFSEGELCFDESGIPLLLSGSDEEGAGTLVATEVSDEIPDGIFELR
jgi:hypothetical protein